MLANLRDAPKCYFMNTCSAAVRVQTDVLTFCFSLRARQNVCCSSLQTTEQRLGCGLVRVSAVTFASSVVAAGKARSCRYRLLRNRATGWLALYEAETFPRMYVFGARVAKPCLGLWWNRILSGLCPHFKSSLCPYQVFTLPVSSLHSARIKSSLCPYQVFALPASSLCSARI
jgi:hypothetical protein